MKFKEERLGFGKADRAIRWDHVRLVWRTGLSMREKLKGTFYAVTSRRFMYGAVSAGTYTAGQTFTLGESE